MPEATTPSPDSGDSNTSDNWESRYAGLQKVLSKRDTDLTAAQAEADTLRKEREQVQAELEAYRQRDVDTSEEEQARQQYEDLKTRFEPENEKPIGNNASKANRGTDENDWLTGSGNPYGSRERTGTGGGFPI